MSITEFFFVQNRVKFREKKNHEIRPIILLSWRYITFSRDTRIQAHRIMYFRTKDAVVSPFVFTKFQSICGVQDSLRREQVA